MAIIQLNGIISNIKGSIGGVTFSNVRAGIALKKRSVGKKSVNSKQLTALNTNKSSASTWRAMSYGDRENWNLFASVYSHVNRYGQTITLTGFNWFTLINTNRVLLGQPVSSVVPSYVVPDAIPSVFVTMSATSVVVTWSTPIDSSTTNILVFASVPSRSQALYNRGGYKLLNIGAISYDVSFDITTAWEYATGLVYADVVSPGGFNINVLIVPVSKISYITGVGQSSTSQLPAFGIGFMEIGTTFIVT